MAKILISTFGLTPHNHRLMPWRTVLEVAAGLRAKRHEVTVLSIVDRSCTEAIGGSRGGPLAIRRRDVREMRSELNAMLGGDGFDVLFIPVSWSRNRLMRELLDGLKGLRIAYLPGSVFEFSQLLPIVTKMPLRKSFPYLAQALCPTVILRRSLAALGVRAVIANTDYSRRQMAKRIDLPIVTITPGCDPIFRTSDKKIESEIKLRASPPYFLFAGPPLPIRGVFVLLDAFLKIADNPDTLPLLCLFRSDSHLDLPLLRTQIERRWSHKKIHFVWESLTLEEFHSHISNSAVVVMPFLVVPSEIPLTVYEAAGMGKTVITTGPHGTGEFVATFGEMVQVGSVGGLADALLRAARAAKGDNIINEEALAAYRRLDTWQAVSDRWEALAINLGMPES